MDILSDILKKVKLSSAVYFNTAFNAPWGMDIPNGPFAQFHMVTKGECILKTRNSLFQLFAGDLVVFPIGTSHWLADSELSERKNGQEVVQSIWNGSPIFEGNSTSTTLVCGHFEFDRNIDHPFTKALPEIIHINNCELQELSWLQNISDLIIQETNAKRSGGTIIITKLGEILFIHTLRAFMQRKSADKGFLAALQDKRISKALKAIHHSPKEDWQLSSLAQISGMSRTGFSNQFKALVGETPMIYITKWRILQAKELLVESKKTVGEIAEQVGYQSEAAFNRVFKKYVFQTPLKYRKSILVS